MTFYDVQQLIGAILPLVAPAAGAIYTWFATRQTAARKEIEGIVKRLESAELQLLAAGHNTTAVGGIETTLAAHDKRLMEIESEFRHMPSKDDVNDLKLVIGRLEEKVGGLQRTVNNLDAFMRTEGKAS